MILHVYYFQIQARDAGIPQLSSTATFTLFVQKANEEVPEFEKDFYNWEIYSDATTGVKVGKVKAQSEAHFHVMNEKVLHM